MKKALLAIHGFLTCTDDWDVLLPYVRGMYDEVVTYKQPGHEPKGVKPHFGDFNAAASFAGLREVAAELKKYDEVDVMGHSMGCAGAAYVCSLLPSVGKIVMFAPAFRYPRPDIFARRGAYLRRLKKLHASCADAELALALAERINTIKESYAASVDLFFRRLLPHWSPRNLFTFARIMREGRRYLADVTAPLCVFWGELDEFIPFSSVKNVLEETSSGEKYFVRYPDDGHAFIYLGNVPRLARDTAAFLRCGTPMGTETTKGESRICCRIVRGAASGYVTLTEEICGAGTENGLTVPVGGSVTDTFADGVKSLFGRLDRLTSEHILP